MREVPANPVAGGVGISGCGHRVAGAIFEAKVAVHVVADRLDSAIAGRRTAEAAPCLGTEDIRQTEAAGEDVDQCFIGKLISRKLGASSSTSSVASGTMTLA